MPPYRLKSPTLPWQNLEVFLLCFALPETRV
jgi:hypothetical protein